MMPQLKWGVIFSAVLIGVGVIVAGIAAFNSPTGWAGVAYGGVLTLAGLGFAVLSQHER